MTPEEFQQAQSLFEELSEQLFEAYRGERAEQLREALRQIKRSVGPDVMPYVQIELGVLDRQRQKTAKFGWIDVSYADDDELFVLGHDTTPRTYLVDGRQVTLPDTQCPRCLGQWSIDPNELAPCPECRCALGDGLQVVAGNECPFCAEPRGAEAARCNCGFQWNAPYVAVQSS